MRPHNQKFLENDSYNYRKKQNHSFSKNSKEKRNISPCLINKQNYSFSNQTIPFNNNDSYSYNYSRGNNELPTNNSRLENPLVYFSKL